MPDNKLTWKKDMRRYASGEIGSLNGVNIFTISYDGLRGRGYLLTTKLPGVKNNFNPFDNIENGKLLAKCILNEWLAKVGLTFK